MSFVDWYKTDTHYVFVRENESEYLIEYNKLKKILESYSDFNGFPVTTSRIAMRVGVSKSIIASMLKLLKFTHSSLPVLPSKIIDLNEDETLEELKIASESSFEYKFQQFKVKDEQSCAKNWKMLKAGMLDPAENFFKKNPVVSKKPVISKVVAKSLDKKKHVIASLQDIHLGEKTLKEHLFHGKDYNSDIAIELVEKYIKDLCQKNKGINSITLIINGDFLHTCFNGTTAQGTKLTSDSLNEDLFERALEILTWAIDELNENFANVEVVFLKGNHDSVVASYLGYAIQSYYRTIKEVKIFIIKTWATMFRVGSLAVIATHGGSDSLKFANIPKNDLQLRTYVQEMMLAKRDQIVGCKNTIVISGHLHSFEHRDMGAFDHYVMGTTVLGDKYADAMNFPRSKPRLNALIVEDGAVIETQHYYF